MHLVLSLTEYVRGQPGTSLAVDRYSSGKCQTGVCQQRYNVDAGVTLTTRTDSWHRLPWLLLIAELQLHLWMFFVVAESSLTALVEHRKLLTLPFYTFLSTQL